MRLVVGVLRQAIGLPTTPPAMVTVRNVTTSHLIVMASRSHPSESLLWQRVHLIP